MNIRIVFFLFFLAFLFILVTDSTLTGMVVFSEPVIVMSYPTADIFIDGKFVGETPQEVHLSSGYHSLVLMAPGHETVTHHINTKEIQKELFVLLEKS